MKLISKNKELAKTLSSLIKRHESISLAVAWASAATDVFDALHEHADRIHRAIIGTHFYQTHPDVLDTFLGRRSVRFILQPDGVFHPKIYLFESHDCWDALVGSANLTAGALRANSEAVLWIGGEKGENELPADLTALIERYWSDAKVIKKIDAVNYREIWQQKQSALNRLNGRYGNSAASKPEIHSSVMSMSWSAYFAAVKTDRYHGFESRCELLQLVRKGFMDHQTYSEMPDALRKTIAGLPNRDEPRWGWFGSNKGAFKFKHAIQINEPHISRGLDEIPLRGTVTRDQFNQYIDHFKRAAPDVRDGIGTASRLLALKRPDQFVTLNARNKQHLCKDLGIKQTGMTYERYWDEVVERIIQTPWWKVSRPNTPQEAAVWDGRAAMLDAIFYH